ncbi:hypothetical protein EfmGK941_11360 [Enterococcus faecium]|nr:hypothetical protein EfmGK941_11360 [Enterococcus faecium]
MNDSIKKMLRITEKDLMITEVSYETLQKKKTLVVDAVLSPTPRAPASIIPNTLRGFPIICVISASENSSKQGTS